jgi:hypothetical protein
MPQQKADDAAWKKQNNGDYDASDDKRPEDGKIEDKSLDRQEDCRSDDRAEEGILPSD